MGKRLARFGLTLNEEKTRFAPFSKAKVKRGIKQEIFDFLGFTFYWGKSRKRKGMVIPKLKTSATRFRGKLKRVNVWARKVRNKAPLKTIWTLFCQKLEGHIRYYGVSFNCKKVASFCDKAIRVMFKWLNRRSQRKSFTWEAFERFRAIHPSPQVKICHALFPII